MKEEKLIADAWEAGSEDYFADDPRRDAFEEGFMRGARWHESLPLAERLTDEKKSTLRDGDFISKAKATGGVVVGWLERIFGKELFTDKTEEH